MGIRVYWGILAFFWFIRVYSAVLGFIRVYSGLLGFEGLGFDSGVWGV